MSRDHWNRCPDCRTLFQGRSPWKDSRCSDCRARKAAYATGLEMIVSGVLIAAVAAGVLLFFLVVYDTTVGYYPHEVYNVGLQQNRLLGVIVSLVAAVGGVVLAVVGRGQRTAAIERYRDRRRAAGRPTPAAEVVPTPALEVDDRPTATSARKED